jgi:hypothetical protein
MTMPIEGLMQIMPPPPEPKEASGDWQAVESSLGTALPDDYRRFIDAYGTGQIDAFLGVLNPFSAGPYYNLLSAGRAHLDGLRELREASGRFLPFPLFPEPGGLLPIAITDNGDTIHWLTNGAPDAWTIVVQDPRAPDCEAYDMPFTAFLAAWIGGTISSGILGPLGQDGHAVFVAVDVPVRGAA